MRTHTIKRHLNDTGEVCPGYQHMLQPLPSYDDYKDYQYGKPVTTVGGITMQKNVAMSSDISFFVPEGSESIAETRRPTVEVEVPEEPLQAPTPAPVAAGGHSELLMPPHKDAYSYEEMEAWVTAVRDEADQQIDELTIKIGQQQSIIDSFEADPGDLVADNIELKSQLALSAGEVKRVEHLLEKEKTLNRAAHGKAGRIQRTLNEHDAANQARIAELEAKLDVGVDKKLADENQRLQGELNTASDIADQQSAEITRLHSQIQQLEESVSAPMSVNGAAVELLQSQIRAKNDEIEGLRNDVADIAKIADERGAEIDRLFHELADKPGLEENVLESGTSSLVESLKAENEQLTTRVNELLNSESLHVLKNIELRARIEELEQATDEAESELAERANWYSPAQMSEQLAAERDRIKAMF
jgi:predicted HicB family RNase H-like nuclease